MSQAAHESTFSIHSPLFSFAPFLSFPNHAEAFTNHNYVNTGKYILVSFLLIQYVCGSYFKGEKEESSKLRQIERC